MLVACSSDQEAHYLAGVLNSSPARAFVSSYAIETQISTHAVKYVHVPRFDVDNPVHRELVSASRAAHKAVAADHEADQVRVDGAAAKLWNLTKPEVEAIRDYLDKLHKRDLEAAT
jgi:hypothetical protein